MGKTEPEAERKVKIKSDIHSRMGCMVAGFWTLFAVVVVVAVAGYFLVNSNGVRELVRSEIADQLGVPNKSVIFDELAICLPYNIQVEALNVFFDDGKTIVDAEMLKLLGPIGFWNGLQVSEGTLTIPKTKDFVELPLVCQGISNLPTKSIEELSLYLFKNYREEKLDFKNCRVVWEDYNVTMRGVDLFFDESVIARDLQVNFCSLQFATYEVGDDIVMRDGSFLWMVYADDSYIEIMNSAKGTNMPKLFFLKEKYDR